MYRPGINEVGVGGEVPGRGDVPVFGCNSVGIAPLSCANVFRDAGGYFGTMDGGKGAPWAEIVLNINNHECLHVAQSNPNEVSAIGLPETHSKATSLPQQTDTLRSCV